MVSVRRVVVPVLLLVAAIPAFGAARKSSSHPPRELHRVGDHWTAYNPPEPATWPAGSKTYTIKQGDTLWGLAQQFYKNAYTWPQLWESNTWITDAHWIYPGDVLLIDSEAVPMAAAETNPALTPTPNANAAPAPAPQRTANAGSPIPLGTEFDVYCYGYIGDPAEPMPNSIGAWEDAETRYQPGPVTQVIGGATGDLVILNGGTASGLVAGDTYIIVQGGELVTKPGSRTQIVGREYRYLGEGLLVQVDLGQADQIQPGDFLTVYRENVGPSQPYQVLGEVGILTTNTHTATGKIMAMRHAMKIGDRVEIR